MTALGTQNGHFLANGLKLPLSSSRDFGQVGTSMGPVTALRPGYPGRSKLDPPSRTARQLSASFHISLQMPRCSEPKLEPHDAASSTQVSGDAGRHRSLNQPRNMPPLHDATHEALELVYSPAGWRLPTLHLHRLDTSQPGHGVVQRGTMNLESLERKHSRIVPLV